MTLETRPEPRNPVLETRRLRLRPLVIADAPFILELFNDPAFLENVGDRGISNREDAEAYLLEGPLDSYEKHGFGLCRVDLEPSGASIGICGLLQRDYLPHPDIGFAVLPDHRSRGYATESSQAVMAHARDTLGIKRLLAITRPDNEASKKILRSLGFEFERWVRPSPNEPEICLFAHDAP